MLYLTLKLMSLKELKFILYKTSTLNVQYYPNAVPKKESSKFLEILNNLPWVKSRSILFGDKGMNYIVRYWNRKTTGPKEDRYNKIVKFPERWNAFPGLKSLKKNIESITNEHFTCCIVQRYINGNNGIKFHQDKEMIPGTTIAGVSFGSTRNLSLKRGNMQVNIPLKSGSLYVLKHPTNSNWFHSITKDPEIEDVRYSITFRNYIQEKE